MPSPSHQRRLERALSELIGAIREAPHATRSLKERAAKVLAQLDDLPDRPKPSGRSVAAVESTPLTESKTLYTAPVKRHTKTKRANDTPVKSPTKKKQVQTAAQQRKTSLRHRRGEFSREELAAGWRLCECGSPVKNWKKHPAKCPVLSKRMSVSVKAKSSSGKSASGTASASKKRSKKKQTRSTGKGTPEPQSRTNSSRRRKAGDKVHIEAAPDERSQNRKHDATTGYAHAYREHGRYGSHPSHDDFSETSSP